MSDVLLLRHGQTEWNATRRLQGRHDSPLTALGRNQVLALSRFASSFPLRRVISSPAGRAQTTATAIARACGCSVVTHPALWEVCFGRCGGLYEDEVERRFPGFTERRRRDKWHTAWPEGESYASAAARVLPWVHDELLDPTSGPVAVVAHQGLNRVLLHLLAGIPVAEVLGFSQSAEVVLRWRDDRVQHLRLPPDVLRSRADDLRRLCATDGLGWREGLPG